ncbi:probable LRR receptor-like serine/threonine-protein kinase At1g06840 [Cornus florida]|uniref:probable LRR receptor-like serine/threonine-protein kinase At1g06840 n=1 Tax=Cornus florida TaxID=4283 RepID=UPI00289C9D85|nr:probable LRR receptor-like serine/threonine-protein kinase At1g06840 [Cornus florida]XP_059659901.1 probable LRR receptor-like serine/threonine-protein kinase At1g06840 [Cornus florida]XP_059659902.1 probable LRR receptor-like serine/threonine-protein kinase At1g06840 [Cornus florida]
MSRLRIGPFGVVLVVWLCWSSLLMGANSQITHPEEGTALQVIKRNLIDPNKNLSNWNRGDPCTSNWTGVLCYNTTMDDGYLHVKELQLLNMNLSGSLSPALGYLSYMKILDFMWNKISGSIPKEIGNITSLELLLLNGNQLTGSLPEEIGYLPNLDRIQIDQNQISGPIPKSFANLNKTKHFHMNNNSISGQIPSELSRLPNLVHMLLDNNNLSGYLPPELAKLPNLLILQLDNNNFDGTTIPASYGNMSHLLKLSLRNCSLQGPIPDLSGIPNLAYIDLSSNQLNGSIPPNRLFENITTIYLSNNNLTGTIPVNLSGLPYLQRLLLANNSLNGSLPSTIWQNRTSNGNESLILDFRNNMLSNFSGSVDLPPNVTLWLQGNPICLNANVVKFCGSQSDDVNNIQKLTNSTTVCLNQSCPPPYEYSPQSPLSCFCAAPLLVGYRLKSPGFWDFQPYIYSFEDYLTNGLKVNLYQLDIDTFVWEKGPRLKMYLKIFPVSDNYSHVFNRSEVLRIRSMFTGWTIPDSDVFGPYELLNFTLLDPYKDVIPLSSTSGISGGAIAGIVIGAIAGAVTCSAIVTLLILRLHKRKHHTASKKRLLSRISMKIDGVKAFTYEEMALATNNFNSSSQVGEGGYGKVYKGILVDGTVVAIKRAQEGSLQGEKEFLTEIEILSRLHHRNLVALIGYCDEEGEQMLVYEFMSNGTLRDQLSGKSKEPMNFAMRLRVALASSKGILYLHTEADPPIFHRDIKASNILLDSKFIAKVADFGLSRLAPVPDLEGILPGHVSTVVKGTPGYLDPEYFLTHKLTDKSDVYSLGVVFLELLTGMPPISHGKNIVREVNIAYHSGMIFSVIDVQMGSYPSELVEKFIKLALKCCQDETDARPSMSDVVRELESMWNMMPESDSRMTESSTIDSGKVMNPSSSSSTTKNPYVSSDVSGSDLVSGVIPTITPR